MGDENLVGEADNVLIVRSAGRVYLQMLGEGKLDKANWDVLVTSQTGQDTDTPPRGEVIKFPGSRFNPENLSGALVDKINEKDYDLGIITYNSFYDFHYTALEKIMEKFNFPRLLGVDQGMNAVKLTKPQLLRWRIVRSGLYLCQKHIIPTYVKISKNPRGRS